MEQYERHILRMEQIYVVIYWKIGSPRESPDINFRNDDNDYSGDPAKES